MARLCGPDTAYAQHRKIIETLRNQALQVEQTGSE